MRSRRLPFPLVLVALALAAPLPAHAFPPYRSTDAGTADPWTLEARLGLLAVQREASSNRYSSPLLRLNLGLPPNLELISEFEYDADEGEAADAAVGFKWVPWIGPLSFGIEALGLLPVAPSQSGMGVESLLPLTIRSDAFAKPLRTHLNAGGFYDPRGEQSESGWKAGAIAELVCGRLRPGIELFAKQVESQDAEVLAGPGMIFDLGPFDLRAGLRAGLTGAANDLEASFWVTTKLPLVSRRSPEHASQ